MGGYFDHAATTSIHPEVAKTLYEASLRYPGNPSSTHKDGVEAALALRAARKKIADLLGASPDEIFFTSGGTEGNNLLLQGAAAAKRKPAPEILYSPAEHSSVAETIEALEKEGLLLRPLTPTENGGVSMDELLAKITPKTGLVTVMGIHNETGAVNDIAAMAKVAKARNKDLFFHSDLVATLGKMPIRLSSLSVDMATFSGHKIRGPKGIGFVYLKKGLHIRPLLYGGEQQNKVRPGTENLPAILALAHALELSLNGMTERKKQAERCRTLVWERLEEGLQKPNFQSKKGDAPYLLHLSTNTVKSETMLNALSAKGFCVSAGSACAKGAQSHVLTAMGLSKERSDTALRISFSDENSESDALALADAIIDAEKTLRHAY